MNAGSRHWQKKRQPEGYFSVDPLPTARELEAFYAGQYYQKSASASYQAAYSEQELAYKRLNAELFLHAIGAVQGGHGRFLEVGCGEGFLLAEARRCGWSVAGIDFSAYAIEQFHPHMRECVVVGDAFAVLEGYAHDHDCFGACVMQNVLEHVLDPRKILDLAHDVLAPDGKLLVTLPNDGSRVQEYLLKEGMVDCEYWICPPQHLHYFDIASASQLARSCGYAVADMFSDFPIETFLFHPGSNYVLSRDAGPAAHVGRMTMSLLCAEQGMDAYLNLCRAYARCGVGRAFTLILTPEKRR